MAGRTTVLVAALLVGVLGCYLVVLGQASAQPEQQYGGDGQGSPAPEQEARGPAPKVTICHATGSETNPYVEITVSTNSAAYQGHLNHPNDIIPAPAGGCPDGPPEPTTPEPTATSTPTATAGPTTPEPTTPEPTTPEPTTPEPTTASPTASPTATGSATTEPTDVDPCPAPEPTTATPSASASVPVTVVPTTPASPTPTASATDEPDPDQPFTPTPTAIATNPGENPDGPFEVTAPDGEVITLSFFDLDVGDDPPLPGGPGGITRAEMRGQRAAAQTLVEGGDFHQAVAAAQPFLNACDCRDAARLAAVQLGVPLPDTGGPASLGILAAALLIGSGIFAWRLGVRGRW